MSSSCLRSQAHRALVCSEPVTKVELVRLIDPSSSINVEASFSRGVGRPVRPELVHPRKVPNRSVANEEGRGMLIHALSHIEFNAINLALDLIVSFRSMPNSFYLDWLKVAKEEALHHELLANRLADLGLYYGFYAAHDGLWHMAERTKDDLLARLGLVPRLLEARGLDVSPGIRSKLASVGDMESASILDIIMRDEIGHVEIGNRWFNWECSRRGLEPIYAFEQCLATFEVQSPRAPFNFEARAKAGFSEAELAWLLQLELEQTAS